MNDPEYHPPARVGNSLWLVPLLGFITIFFLSLAWAGFDKLLWGTTFFTIPAFGAYLTILGMLAVKLCRWSRCRHVLVARLLGFALGSYAVLSSWVWFALFTLPHQPGVGYFPLLRQPGAVWSFARDLADKGMIVYTSNKGAAFNGVHTSETHGMVLWIFWALEAVLTIAALTWIMGTAANATLYCEHCRQTVKPTESRRFQFPDAATLTRARNGDFDAVLGCGPVPTPVPTSFLKLKTFLCQRCGQLAVWRLFRSGKSALADFAVGPYRLLSPEEGARLQAPPGRPS